MKFVHVADVHLDTRYVNRDEHIRRQLREAGRTAFRRAVDLAVSEDVDAFLIAGDLFDGERLSFETERLLLAEMAKLQQAGIHVVYATGNHDPGREGHRSWQLEWPSNVTVVRDHTPQEIDIYGSDGHLVGRVTAAGHETRADTEDLASTFPRPQRDQPLLDGDVAHVGMLHSQVVGARATDAHERYAPAELDTLIQSGYDYWALGHVHLRQPLSEDPPIWYPGNPQGTNPGETGAKGALLVDLSPEQEPEIRFVPLGPIRWEHLRVDGLEEDTTLDDIQRRVRSIWIRERDEDPGHEGCDWILRVELVGPCPLHRQLTEAHERQTIAEALVDDLGLLDAEIRTTRLHAPVDPAEHRERQDTLGQALRMLDQASSDPELRRRLEPDHLAGAPNNEDEYLADLLEGLDHDLVARMIDSGDSRGRSS